MSGYGHFDDNLRRRIEAERKRKEAVRLAQEETARKRELLVRRTIYADSDDDDIPMVYEAPPTLDDVRSVGGNHLQDDYKPLCSTSKSIRDRYGQSSMTNCMANQVAYSAQRSAAYASTSTRRRSSSASSRSSYDRRSRRRHRSRSRSRGKRSRRRSRSSSRSRSRSRNRRRSKSRKRTRRSSSSRSRSSRNRRSTSRSRRKRSRRSSRSSSRSHSGDHNRNVRIRSRFDDSPVSEAPRHFTENPKSRSPSSSSSSDSSSSDSSHSSASSKFSSGRWHSSKSSSRKTASTNKKKWGFIHLSELNEKSDAELVENIMLIDRSEIFDVESLEQVPASERVIRELCPGSRSHLNLLSKTKTDLYELFYGNAEETKRDNWRYYVPRSVTLEEDNSDDDDIDASPNRNAGMVWREEDGFIRFGRFHFLDVLEREKRRQERAEGAEEDARLEQEDCVMFWKSKFQDVQAEWHKSLQTEGLSWKIFDRLMFVEEKIVKLGIDDGSEVWDKNGNRRILTFADRKLRRIEEALYADRPIITFDLKQELSRMRREIWLEMGKIDEYLGDWERLIEEDACNVLPWMTFFDAIQYDAKIYTKERMEDAFCRCLQMLVFMYDNIQRNPMSHVTSMTVPDFVDFYFAVYARRLHWLLDSGQKVKALACAQATLEYYYHSGSAHVNVLTLLCDSRTARVKGLIAYWSSGLPRFGDAFDAGNVDYDFAYRKFADRSYATLRPEQYRAAGIDENEETALRHERLSKEEAEVVEKHRHDKSAIGVSLYRLERMSSKLMQRPRRTNGYRQSERKAPLSDNMVCFLFEERHLFDLFAVFGGRLDYHHSAQTSAASLLFTSDADSQLPNPITSSRDALDFVKNAALAFVFAFNKNTYEFYNMAFNAVFDRVWSEGGHKNIAKLASACEDELLRPLKEAALSDERKNVMKALLCLWLVRQVRLRWMKSTSNFTYRMATQLMLTIERELAAIKASKKVNCSTRGAVTAWLKRSLYAGREDPLLMRVVLSMVIEKAELYSDPWQRLRSITAFFLGIAEFSVSDDDIKEVQGMVKSLSLECDARANSESQNSFLPYSSLLVQTISLHLTYAIRMREIKSTNEGWRSMLVTELMQVYKRLPEVMNKKHPRRRWPVFLEPMALTLSGIFYELSKSLQKHEDYAFGLFVKTCLLELITDCPQCLAIRQRYVRICINSCSLFALQLQFSRTSIFSECSSAYSNMTAVTRFYVIIYDLSQKLEQRKNEDVPQLTKLRSQAAFAISQIAHRNIQSHLWRFAFAMLNLCDDGFELEMMYKRATAQMPWLKDLYLDRLLTVRSSQTVTNEMEKWDIPLTYNVDAVEKLLGLQDEFYLKLKL